jgi:D-glycero-D-manno-heptose 1,7-bisphosphate phosphatase
MAQRRFALLDRDGTLIAERNYLADPDGVELLPGVPEALRRLSDLGLGLLVVTNQSAIARGLLDEPGLAAIHRRMRALLAARGARVDEILVCPHHPEEGCDCRKPRPGLVLRAAARLGFEPRECFVVGDLESDVELGRALGATTFLVRTGHGARTEGEGRARPEFVVDGLREVAEVVERLLADPA